MKATPMAGTIAIALVKRTLCQTGNLISKNPSMTNWPAYVPVIVDDYPDANKPMAQIYLATEPNSYERADDALSRFNSSIWGFFYL